MKKYFLTFITLGWLWLTFYLYDELDITMTDWYLLPFIITGIVILIILIFFIATSIMDGELNERNNH